MLRREPTEGEEREWKFRCFHHSSGLSCQLPCLLLTGRTTNFRPLPPPPPFFSCPPPFAQLCQECDDGIAQRENRRVRMLATADLRLNIFSRSYFGQDWKMWSEVNLAQCSTHSNRFFFLPQQKCCMTTASALTQTYFQTPLVRVDRSKVVFPLTYFSKNHTPSFSLLMLQSIHVTVCMLAAFNFKSLLNFYPSTECMYVQDTSEAKPAQVSIFHFMLLKSHVSKELSHVVFKNHTDAYYTLTKITRTNLCYHILRVLVCLNGLCWAKNRKRKSDYTVTYVRTAGCMSNATNASMRDARRSPPRPSIREQEEETSTVQYIQVVHTGVTSMTKETQSLF